MSTTTTRTNAAAIDSAMRHPSTPDKHELRRPPRPLRAATQMRSTRSAQDTPPISDPSALCCSVVQAAVEVLRGIRPLAQLSRWLTPEVYEALARRREITTAGGSPTSTLQARIRRARVIRVSQSAAEATVIVQDEHRVRAAAIRVEHLRGNWRVVAFELG